MTPLPGLLVTIEGVEGAGKSTLLEALAARARAAGCEAVACREPAAPPSASACARRCSAARLPRRAPSCWSSPPRAPSSSARSCARRSRAARSCSATASPTRPSPTSTTGGDCRSPRSRPRHAAATGGLAPRLTLLLDLDPALGRRRAGGAGDYIEREADGFHERVRAGYLALAAAAPARWRVLDAGRAPAALAEDAWREVERARGALTAPPPRAEDGP